MGAEEHLKAIEGLERGSVHCFTSPTWIPLQRIKLKNEIYTSFWKVLKNFIYCFLILAACGMKMFCEEIIIPVGIENRDTVTMIREQDNNGNYDVGYNENLLTGGASFHRERGYSNGTRQGSYGYTTRNGLIRIVTYTADQDGYRAELLTNEPGIGIISPSNVNITKEKEPDPEALARGPTGVGSPQSTIAPSSDAVKNYVTSQNEFHSNSLRTATGSAQVMISAPYGQYQYVV